MTWPSLYLTSCQLCLQSKMTKQQVGVVLGIGLITTSAFAAPLGMPGIDIGGGIVGPTHWNHYVFTQSTTFTLPPNSLEICARLVAGGGSGSACSRGSNLCSFSGGGGGGGITYSCPTYTSGAALAIVIGPGGAAAVATGGIGPVAGNAGGNTTISVGSAILAAFGGTGPAASLTPPGTGGVGGDGALTSGVGSGSVWGCYGSSGAAATAGNSLSCPIISSVGGTTSSNGTTYAGGGGASYGNGGIGVTNVTSGAAATGGAGTLGGGGGAATATGTGTATSGMGGNGQVDLWVLS